MARDVYERPAVYEENGIWVFRGSSFGNCERALVKAAHGETPMPMPEAVQKGMNQGKELEDEILRGCGGHGWNMLDGMRLESHGPVNDAGQLALELKCGSRAVIRVHPDGVAKKFKGKVGDEDMGVRRVVEAKALKRAPGDVDGVFKKFPGYAWQTSIEMAATGLGLLFAIGDKTDGGDELTGVRVFEVDEPAYTKGQIIARALRLVKLIEGDEVPDCDWAMYPCGFYQDHGGQKIWEQDVQERVCADEVAVDLAKIVECAQVEKAKWQKDYDDARKELAALVDGFLEKEGGSGDRRVRISGTGVTLVKKSGRARFDRKAAEKDGLELGKYDKPGNDYWETQVKDTGNEET